MLIRLGFCSLWLAAIPLAAFGHHNFAAHYRGEDTIELIGTVTEFRFINPHARVYFDVETAENGTETWMAEGDASVALRRSGWTPDQLKPGDRVQIVGNPSRNGTRTLSWDRITLADGSEIGGGDGRVDERLRILDRALAGFRAGRGR
jgi:hypothetical protein